jgi:hypothetical protein
MFNFEMCDPCNADKSISLCTGDCRNNIWYVDGKCKLDELTYDQVYFILQRNPNAKNDLLRITNCENLLRLARNSHLISDDIEDNLTPYRMINNPARTLPYYTLFRGDLNGNFKP